MSVYYNEIDSFCCDWLRGLIRRGLLPDGEIDNRSIEDVRPDELTGFTQCHFFAGIGGWPYALRLAGWPDDRQVWTGSCPCQPFSTAGKRTGFADERHLWPAFFHLISQCKPDTVIGEQVASKGALAWCDTVFADLESEGYSCGAVDTCAAGFGAPHIRQRLYWVAQSQSYGWGGRCYGDTSRVRGEIQTSGRSTIGELEYTQCSGLQGQSEPDRSSERWQEQAGCPVHTDDETCGMGNAEKIRRQQEQAKRYGPPEKRVQTGSERGTCVSGQVASRMGDTESYGMENRPEGRGVASETDGTMLYGLDSPVQTHVSPMPTNGFWGNPDWLWCRDKKWRPIESGTVPLVDGFSKRMGRGGDFRAIRQRLQGYGNAIVVPQAVEFIKAVMGIL